MIKKYKIDLEMLHHVSRVFSGLVRDEKMQLEMIKPWFKRCTNVKDVKEYKQILQLTLIFADILYFEYDLRNRKFTIEEAIKSGIDSFKKAHSEKIGQNQAIEYVHAMVQNCVNLRIFKEV